MCIQGQTTEITIRIHIVDLSACCFQENLHILCIYVLKTMFVIVNTEYIKVFNGTEPRLYLIWNVFRLIRLEKTKHRVSVS